LDEKNIFTFKLINEEENDKVIFEYHVPLFVIQQYIPHLINTANENMIDKYECTLSFSDLNYPITERSFGIFFKYLFEKRLSFPLIDLTPLIILGEYFLQKNLVTDCLQTLLKYIDNSNCLFFSNLATKYDIKNYYWNEVFEKSYSLIENLITKNNESIEYLKELSGDIIKRFYKTKLELYFLKEEKNLNEKITFIFSHFEKFTFIIGEEVSILKEIEIPIEIVYRFLPNLIDKISIKLNSKAMDENFDIKRFFKYCIYLTQDNSFEINIEPSEICTFIKFLLILNAVIIYLIFFRIGKIQ
jgi:hypothetical protein